MCLAVPMLLEERDGDRGTADLGGAKRKVDLSLVPEARVGDYLIVHAGFAIERLDEAEARETLSLLEQLHEATEEGPVSRGTEAPVGPDDQL